MSRIIAEMYSKIEQDAWRNESGFSIEIEEYNHLIEKANNDEDKIAHILRTWLQKYQPCLFGRIAARLNLLSFCILTEKDLLSDDDHIQNKIQSARTKWTKEGFSGHKSGFIVAALSTKLATSIPSQNLMNLAKAICLNYLLEEIEENVIYTDEIWLEKPGSASDKTTWKWKAGVNYFCSNADKRWWQDHRFPGGLAFSVNSVGHMAKACGIAKFMNELNTALGLNSEYTESKVDSLEQALEFAMRTIDMASDSISGKATELVPAQDNSCPIRLPKNLEGKDCKIYSGYYHTDITIPSEYFISDIERPDNCEVKTLDFSYLYDSNSKNVDHITMGKGRQIRKTSHQLGYRTNPKISKVFAEEEIITYDSRLHKALNQ